jgi:hypothetical protein
MATALIDDPTSDHTHHVTEESDCTHASLTMKEGKSGDCVKPLNKVRLEEIPVY